MIVAEPVRVERPRMTVVGSNEYCARIIAAEPDRYAGLMVEWARRVLARAHKNESEKGVMSDGGIG